MPSVVMIFMAIVFSISLLPLACCASVPAEWIVYKGHGGPGKGKHIVLISGDEEYRSEEALPQLGKILALHHGFTCTVLFAIDPESGEINPENQTNLPGLSALNNADLMIIATRFRDLPDEQMAYIDAYLRAGKPVIGMRTATHAFAINSSETYRKYSWNYDGEDFRQGFGRQILGETWIAHHGEHSRQSTGGMIAEDARTHPILRGIKDREIWGPTDVYRVRLPLAGGSLPLVLGAVLSGMSQDDDPVQGDKNEPMMPVAWTKTYEVEQGHTGRVFTTTMGAATDLVSQGTRRMLVNAVYWALRMEELIPKDGTSVELVGQYDPSDFGFGQFKRGVKPAEHAMPERDQ